MSQISANTIIENGKRPKHMLQVVSARYTLLVFDDDNVDGICLSMCTHISVRLKKKIK